jgi:transformer-2 protein
LSHKVSTNDLEAAFAKVGRVRLLTLFPINRLSFSDVIIPKVKKASVMHDPHTRESRGFGFVTMETAEEADAAITALNATDLMGKVMNVERVCTVDDSVMLLADPYWQARRGRARTPTPGRYYGPPKRNDCTLSFFLPGPR